MALCSVVGLAGCDGCGCGSTGDARKEAQTAEAGCPPGSQPVQGAVRPAALAGSWYPGDAAALRASVNAMLAAAPAYEGGRPLALVSPHAGHRFSGATAAHGYRAIQGQRYQRVYLIGPSHHASFPGISIPSYAEYETPLGRVPVDRAAADALLAAAPFVSRDEVHRREHCIEIQLPFLQQVLEPGFAIVPMLVGTMEVETVQEAAARLRAIIGPEDLLIASSDFTHFGPSYGYQPFAEDVPTRLAELADDAWSAIEQRDLDAFYEHQQRTGDTICGFRPVAVLLAALPAEAKARRLAFDTSGRVSGDYENSVSYLSVAFSDARWSGKPPPAPAGCVGQSAVVLTAGSQRVAHDIARRALEGWVREGERFDARTEGLAVAGELSFERGVFVTLKKHGKLRGCIGNLVPRGPLYETIAGRAIDASRDSRFEPVAIEELGDIEIEISVLTLPLAVPGPEAIVLGRDGVTLRKGGRSATFLPQVPPEQGWNVEQTLEHLSLKAGLGEGAWRSGASFETYQAQVF